MTDKQMRRILKAEGWIDLGAGCINDPVRCKTYGPSFIDRAYRIASRRKAAREARLLRISGFYNDPGYGWKERGVDSFWMSRAEALDQMNEDKSRAAK